MIKRSKKYSVFSLMKNALSYHENWQPAWRNPEIKKEYDAIIVGGVRPRRGLRQDGVSGLLPFLAAMVFFHQHAFSECLSRS